MNYSTTTCLTSKPVIPLYPLCENNLKANSAAALWGVGVSYVGDYSPTGLTRLTPYSLQDPPFLLYTFCGSVMRLFTLLIWPGMKCSKLQGYRWVSVCVGGRKSCHIVECFSILSLSGEKCKVSLPKRRVSSVWCWLLSLIWIQSARLTFRRTSIRPL